MATTARPRPEMRTPAPHTAPRQAPSWRRPGPHVLLALAVVACLNTWLLVHFHDRTWWPPDEGNYAHVAERILQGEVLHADVQDVHPGYVNFANAGAMAAFGRELVSMRYPLVLLGILQSGMVFLLLRRAGLKAAATGATAITALGFVQFLDPTAHWYALSCTILLAWLLQRRPSNAPWRLDAVGAVIATAVLFRQLSGILLAMGALAYLLLDHRDASDGAAPASGDTATDASGAFPDGTPWLARGLATTMLLGLTAYLARSTDAVGWLLFGIWPALLLIHVARATRVPDRAVVGMLAPLARGGALASVPLVVYHVAHGSLGAWYDDVVVAAMSLPRMPFFEAASYASVIGAAGAGVVSGELAATLNGLLWLLLSFAAVAVGVLLLSRMTAREGVRAVGAPAALPTLAVFYAVVSVHYQIPIYLTYTAGVSLAALIHLARGATPVVLGVAAAIPIALYFQAGQPVSRGIDGTVSGRRLAVQAAPAIDRSGLRVEAADAVVYRGLVDLIRQEAAPDEAIFAVPSHAELYFLAERRNPFRFFNTALGVVSAQQLDTVLATLDRDPPRLVLHDPTDKYNTAASQAIMMQVRASYEPLDTIGHIQVWRRRQDSP